ncbi:MAG: hypothetical protein HQ567_35425 [Candidatus Nealsonbacteria bacterium]|nr:hypothetical protein [Candidatus Nealsonbacteria bacterium]
MLDDTYYVPVLRWKAAEKGALQWLYEKDKSRVTPLVEIIPPAFQSKDDGKSLPVRTVLRTIAMDIEKCWGSSPLFVDVDHVVNAGVQDPSGCHLLEVLTQETRNLLPLFPDRSHLVPVTRLGRPRDYLRAVSSIVEEDKTGACFRITAREASHPKLANKLEALLTRLRLEMADVDLLVDYQAPSASHPDLNTLCELLPQLSKWRSFVVLIGAFPKDLQELEKNRRHTLQRNDWLSWKNQVLMVHPAEAYVAHDSTKYGFLFSIPAVRIAGENQPLYTRLNRGEEPVLLCGVLTYASSG